MSLQFVDAKLFINRREIRDGIAEKELRVLAKTGGFTRQVMRRTMRKRRKGKLVIIGADGERINRPAGTTGGSKPGEPPRWITKGLRDRIFFGIPLDGLRVVVGPEKFKSEGGGTIPALLNAGGPATTELPSAIGEPVPIRYLMAPRPFATSKSPAFVAGFERFQELTGTEPFRGI